MSSSSFIDKISQKRCWVELSRDNLSYNLFQIKKLLPAGCRIMGIVKANAYGHGSCWVARELCRLGIDYLGVATVAEAIELRELDIDVPILCLGAADLDYAELASEYKLSQLLTSYEQARQFEQVANEKNLTLNFHIKLDTGMSRLGFDCRHQLAESLEEIVAVNQLEHIKLEGILTHFNNAEAVTSELHQLQHKLFQTVVTALEERGVHFEYIHSANSASLVNEEVSGNMVRPGILLYGCLGSTCEKPIDLRPVMTFKSRLVALQKLQPGDSVSYGPSFVAEREMLIGVVEVGYADGILRSMSNRAIFSVHGRPAPIVGTVCMDRLMVDLSAVPHAKVNDEVIIFGDSNSGFDVSADVQAERSGTIAYELMCSVGQRVERYYQA